MKYKITKRDIAIILGFIGVLVLGLTYYFVYMEYSEKTEQLRAENATLQSRVDILQSIADQQEQLIADTRSFEEKSEEIMEHYPAGFQDEDGFMLAVDLQAISPLETVSSVANSDPLQLYVFEDIKSQTDQEVGEYIQLESEFAQAEGEESPENTEASFPVLNCKDTTITCTCDYPAFKNAAAYLIDKNEKHSIKIQGVYDITTGILASVYTIRSPYITNTDKQYAEPEVPFIVQGTDNIFGTVPLQNSRAVTYGTTRASESVQLPQAQEESNAEEPVTE